jgi:predicted Zn finger-like uncharacterized protein
MEITCKKCQALFRVNVELPLPGPVRVACPSCGKQKTLRPAPAEPAAPEAAAPVAPPKPAGPKVAVIADEARPFRTFLGDELKKLGFDTHFFETGHEALEKVRESRARLVILNVYLKGKLGVEISEEIKADENLSATKVVLIGALFRANRFRANPTNLYGADEYIEELIPAKELQQIVAKLFPPGTEHVEQEPLEYDEARRLARLILSDIIIYNADKVEEGVREGTFFDLLEAEIEDGRDYYESRVPFKVKQRTEFFHETLHQFVDMKREEMGKAGAGRG